MRKPQPIVQRGGSGCGLKTFYGTGSASVARNLEAKRATETSHSRNPSPPSKTKRCRHRAAQLDSCLDPIKSSTMQLHRTTVVMQTYTSSSGGECASTSAPPKEFFRRFNTRNYVNLELLFLSSKVPDLTNPMIRKTRTKTETIKAPIPEKIEMIKNGKMGKK
eukprot:1747563-Amphidinium_carterae.1